MDLKRKIKKFLGTPFTISVNFDNEIMKLCF